ncbi:DUF6602 domain-containing protein [Pseudomonas simiae]|uniref:DUF6602 domain-containing protein n=1 Tax=Pseudomonas simiae TaxID=321846 RepID=UPI002735CB3F|nr:DUF6602 domain-containing protein [Pseudomonas simiae]WLH99824.1 hypothetical protein PSH95_20725 [Pseudomonas simiae]
MKFADGDSCFINEDDWHSLESYNYLNGYGDHATVMRRTGEIKELTSLEKSRLIHHPFSLTARNKRPENYRAYIFVLDISSSIIRERKKISLPDLCKILLEDKRLKADASSLELLLKSLVANKSLSVSIDGRKKNKIICLSLGEALKEREKQRLFAASIASELDALSQRVRLIVSHAGTVGTYRENLLQNVLRKHLPERYHIAFGFIYGCPRQIDILIYDRLEYAPLFREGDLVVVPANSVRAAIEVKTDLTLDLLKESLSLLSEVGIHDDGNPPIFKSIFAFESSTTEDSLCKTIRDHYNSDDDEEIFNHISKPFEHISCACVLEKDYVYVRYRKLKGGNLIPSLYTKKSTTGLNSQAAFFMQELLSHLKSGGAKKNQISYTEEMLGADTLMELSHDLADPEWGAYFAQAHGIGDDPHSEVDDMERNILGVQNWLDGYSEDWNYTEEP